MKIKHNIKRNWNILSGRILETIFEGWEERQDRIEHYTKDWEFYICSLNVPTLDSSSLYVFWKDKDIDDNYLEYEYDTEDEAQQVLDYINEFTIEDKEIKNWYSVWVSDISQEDADNNFKNYGNYHYIWKDTNWNFVCESSDWEYLSRKFVSNKKSNTREHTKEYTIKELEEKLWEIIKIIR